MRELAPSALVAILITVLLTVAGQILVKMGMVEMGPSPREAGPMALFLLRGLLNPKVAAGLACAVGAALAWMAALSRTPLNWAYPFMALPVVAVLALSGVLLDETVPWNRWVGVGIVCLGLIVASFR